MKSTRRIGEVVVTGDQCQVPGVGKVRRVGRLVKKTDTGGQTGDLKAPRRSMRKCSHVKADYF